MNDDLLRSQAGALLQVHRFPGAREDALVALLKQGVPLRLPDGAELCREGDQPDALFFLLEGKVRVMRRDSKGRDRELTIETAPAMVGHMAMVDGSPRSATCIASGPVRAIALDRKNYQELLKEATPRGTTLRRLLLSSLSQQLTDANERLLGLLAAVEQQLSGDQGELEEITGEHVMQVAGVLDGWKMDVQGAQSVEVVQTGQQPRRPSR